MKLYYSFPVKLLALVLLLILLTGAGLGLFTVAICVDGDAYDSGSWPIAPAGNMAMTWKAC